MNQRPKNNPRNGAQWFPHRKKFEKRKSSSKVLSSVFWGKDGIFLVDYPEWSATFATEDCVVLLDKRNQ
jgi:hypothetical protein